MATAAYSNAAPLPGGAQQSLAPQDPYQQFQRIQQQQPPPRNQRQGPQVQYSAPGAAEQARQQAQRPPMHQSTPSQEEKRNRAFSFRSDKSHKSHKSSGSQTKFQLTPETHEEKEAKRLHSKADPMLAMMEAEPSAVASGVKSSMAPLRSLTHLDANGQPIADPDKSNPTRYRWERPLDTIRSFEAAIDGGYSRKSVYNSGDAESVAYGNNNRRSSYYANNSARYPQDGNYGSGRPPSNMHASASQHDLRQTQPRDNYYDQGGYNNGYYGQNGQAGGRPRYSRMTTEPQQGYGPRSNENVYPMPNNQRSYETVASGGSGEPAGYQTDPTSSDNSSIERMQSPLSKAQQRRPDQPMNDYGIGFQNPSYQPTGFAVGKAPMQLSQSQGQSQAQAPAVPQKGGIARKPTNKLLSKVSSNDDGEKRKSWFSKRFSRDH